jgi:Domain of unknown function (DUF6946)
MLNLPQTKLTPQRAQRREHPHILVPSDGPNSWRQFLADPGKQWVAGHAARALAYCWEAAGGLPPEVAAMFAPEPELLVAIPEHQVPLPGAGHDSQNDIFAIVRSGYRTHAVAVEGKVRESFGPTVDEWFSSPTSGKRQCLKALYSVLGLSNIPPGHVRYSLLQRAASALIEAWRFKTDEAAMIVHSFASDRVWFDDFATFCELFELEVEPDRPAVAELPDGMLLRLGWATGDSRFLKS